MKAAHKTTPHKTTPQRLALFCGVLLIVACGRSDADGGSDSAVGPDAATDAGGPADSGVPDASVADTGPDASPEPSGPEGVGPHAVSLRRATVDVGGRALPVLVWAPTDEVESTRPIADLLEAERRPAYDALLDAAPADCPTRSVSVALDAPPLAGPWPLVLYSHCHACLAVSGATVAHRLASWGAVVLAPDHVDNTLWDALADDLVPFSGEFLPVRGGDLVGLLDAVDAQDPALGAVGGVIDPDRVVVVGHSFGAVTAGWVAERDPRISGLVALAAPIANPLIPGVTAANVTVPTLMVVATEDNSITEAGNVLMRRNFEALAGPAVKVELRDAGHWSVSDLCGLTEMFAPGCGADRRQTDRTPFEYPDPASLRALTATWVTGAVRAWIADEPEWLDAQTSDDQVAVDRR